MRATRSAFTRVSRTLALAKEQYKKLAKKTYPALNSETVLDAAADNEVAELLADTSDETSQTKFEGVFRTISRAVRKANLSINFDSKNPKFEATTIGMKWRGEKPWGVNPKVIFTEGVKSKSKNKDRTKLRDYVEYNTSAPFTSASRLIDAAARFSGPICGWMLCLAESEAIIDVNKSMKHVTPAQADDFDFTKEHEVISLNLDPDAENMFDIPNHRVFAARKILVSLDPFGIPFRIFYGPTYRNPNYKPQDLSNQQKVLTVCPDEHKEFEKAHGKKYPTIDEIAAVLNKERKRRDQEELKKREVDTPKSNNENASIKHISKAEDKENTQSHDISSQVSVAKLNNPVRTKALRANGVFKKTINKKSKEELPSVLSIR